MKNKKRLFVLGLIGFLPLASFAQMPTQNAAGPSIASLGTPTFSGTGCSASNTSFTSSPDNKAISFIFDQYAAYAGAGAQGQNKPSDGRTCNVSIPINLPAGVRVAIKSAQYRGFVALPSGGSAAISARYRFADTARTKYSPGITKAFQGPVTSTFDFQTAEDPATIYSGCGGKTTLVLSSWMNVYTNSSNGSVQMVVDSLDGALNPKWAVDLVYESCIPVRHYPYLPPSPL